MPTNGLHERGRLRSRPGRTSEGTSPVGLRSLGSDAGPADGYLYVPAGYLPETPAPLVLLLHGAGEDARDGLAQLRGQADEAGLILLALGSRGPTWDLMLNRGRYGADVAAIDRALGYAFSRCAVDPERVGVGRLLRWGLLRPRARVGQRRPLLARPRLLAGVFGADGPEGLAARLRLARHQGRVAPDRPLQPQDRPPATARRLRCTLPRVRRRPRGPARCRAGGNALVHRRGLKTRRLFALV